MNWSFWQLTFRNLVYIQFVTWPAMPMTVNKTNIHLVRFQFSYACFAVIRSGMLCVSDCDVIPSAQCKHLEWDKQNVNKTRETKNQHARIIFLYSSMNLSFHVKWNVCTVVIIQKWNNVCTVVATCLWIHYSVVLVYIYLGVPQLRK